MIGRRSLIAIAVSVAGIAPPATAIDANEVVLLTNGLHPVAAAIRDAYLAAHPGVHVYDVALTYPHVGSEADRQSSPPAGGINDQYITPAAFNTHFGEGSAFRAFLSANPEITTIVTTRGLPAAISDNFDPLPITGGSLCQPCDGVHASFEAELTRPGLGTPLTQVSNPYQGADQSFRDFLGASCLAGGPCAGDIYLVARIDAGSSAGGDPAQAAVALVNRSTDLTLNTFATTVLADTGPLDSLLATGWEQLAEAAWDIGWCAIHDATTEFIHGPADAAFDPIDDGPFATHPVAALFSIGIHHAAIGGGDVAGADYVAGYNAHPAGLFLSTESFNGWSLHDWQDTTPAHGRCTDWIASSGGSFTVANVHEPTTAAIANERRLFCNLFERGYPYGEAAYLSMPTLGQFQTVIGDPLATVAVHRPDVDGDHDVDHNDVVLVLSAFETSDPDADVTGDGVVDGADLDAVNLANGRSCAHPHGGETSYPPHFSCGDVNSDCIVGFQDLIELLSVWGPCPIECCSNTCPRDVDGDFVIGFSDIVIVLSNWNRLIGDCDLDGDVDSDDVTCIFDAIGGGTYVPAADINCDGEVDFEDVLEVQSGCD